MKIKGMGLEVN